MHIIRVTDQSTAREFISFTSRLYHREKAWSHFQQKHAKEMLLLRDQLLLDGESQFWILSNFRGETIGRIAAFVDRSREPHHPTGFFGLFECINHRKAASLLLDECQYWLKQFGIQEMHGPLHFLAFHQGWVAENKSSQPSFPLLSFQAAYYQELFEVYGFKALPQNVLYHLDSTADLLDNAQKKLAEQIIEGDTFAIKKVDKKDFSKTSEDIAAVCAKTADPYSPCLSAAEVMRWLRQLYHLSYDPSIWIAYHQEEAVAFSVNAIVPSKDSMEQHGKRWHQLLSRFSSKTRSIINLSTKLAACHQDSGLLEAMLYQVNEYFSADNSPRHDAYLFLGDTFSHPEIAAKQRTEINTYYKYSYQFEQAPLIGTFAKSNADAPD
jgi:hypothetical protein